MLGELLVVLFGAASIGMAYDEKPRRGKAPIRKLADRAANDSGHNGS